VKERLELADSGHTAKKTVAKRMEGASTGQREFKFMKHAREKKTIQGEEEEREAVYRKREKTTTRNAGGDFDSGNAEEEENVW